MEMSTIRLSSGASQQRLKAMRRASDGTDVDALARDALCGKNEEVFEELVRRKTPFLLGFFRRCGDVRWPGGEPEDLTQVVFIKVLKEKYDPSRPFERRFPH